ncbi:carbohydrate ABC transporter permease [Occultella aeris]|uniref:L-arabinose transport system permease protein AraQ n=1 Tax=Occultella aeris TaxID=2761496 RepID=A0A7M4DGE4_9MICO|nr:carbohydrate ABC transporter permease [Occultella aeris]VZO35987.1 L-arabinose transport system permease protein AraQ [Occultella aeris]
MRTRTLGLSLTGLVVAVVYLIPVYWMVATSLKETGDVFNTPPDLVPNPPTLAAYRDAVFGDSAVLQGIWSSTIITIPTLLLTLALAVPAAYGLARFSLRVNGVVMLLMLAAQMLPTISLALPMFAIFSDYGLVDTYAGLIIANTSLALPFAVVMLRPYMLAIPQDLMDAGLLDGCTGFRAFWKIGLPLVQPGLVMVATLTFVMTWGEFVFGLTLATSDAIQPITVVLNRFVAQFGTQWTNLMAVSTIIAIPIIVIFVLLQKYVVAGISEGGIKD